MPRAPTTFWTASSLLQNVLAREAALARPRDLFGEVVQLWLDDALAAVIELLKNPRRFLENHVGRIAAIGGRSRLRTHLR